MSDNDRTTTNDKASNADLQAAASSSNDDALSIDLKPEDVWKMSADELVEQFAQRRRGRPSKKDLQVREAALAAQADPSPELLDRARTVAAALVTSMTSAERRRKGSTQPTSSDNQPKAQKQKQKTASATASSEKTAEAAETKKKAEEPEETAVSDAAKTVSEESSASPYGTRRRRREHHTVDAAQIAQGTTSAQDEGQPQPEDQKTSAQNAQQHNHEANGAQNTNGNNQRNGAQHANFNQNQQFSKNNKRHNNNRNQQREVITEPKVTREELEEAKVGDLCAKAAEFDIDPTGLKKSELVDAVYEAMVRQEGFFGFKGILDLTNDGFGFVRTKGYLPSENDVYVGASTVRACGLRRGDEVEGIARLGRPSDKFPAACKITLVNGKATEELRNRPRFGDLTPVFPCEQLKMEHGKDSTLGRCIDLVAPIGKGQRGLIVSPPKAGKTTVLKKIAESIAANNPEVHLICLLVDERPEEVTDMQRSIKGEVVASTFDMPCDNHITVAELVIERAKRLVEQGEDVVILLDSITRLARAYNLAQPASGRILSGGVDSTALYPPKRFLGAARNIEGGGSLTILASALIDTGSKMDEVIFEEFKGTGNMELKLDRDLADRRIFPAIDPISSGTRKEELLLDGDIAPFVWGLRRVLANMNNNERAMTSLIKGLKNTSNNEEFLIRNAKKAQTQELNGEL